MKLAALGGVAAATGITFRSPLEAWANRFGAGMSRGDGFDLRVELRGREQIAESLNALHSIADAGLRCEGPEVFGSCAGERFVLRFA